jgi:exosortase/archaeosortase family protein
LGDANTDRGIQLTNKSIHFLRRYLSSDVFSWKALASLQAILSIWLVQVSQHDPSLTLLAVVVWGGAVICLEDKLDTLVMKPSRFSFFAGCLLLLLVTVRTTLVLDKERLVLILPLLQGLALALLLRPIPKLPSLGQVLVVLSLFPLQDLAMRLLPDYMLSVITAKLSQGFLLVFGFNATSSGRFVLMGARGVEVLGECNSVDLIAQLTAIAIVFALAFPIRSRGLRLSFIALAPLIAVIVNAGRIAILAALVTSELDYGYDLFTFLHDKWGSLIFAGIATMILGQIYMALIDRELQHHHG